MQMEHIVRLTKQQVCVFVSVRGTLVDFSVTSAAHFITKFHGKWAMGLRGLMTLLRAVNVSKPG